MNEIKVWNYESSEVRTIEKDGEPWWILADVCKVLELSNPQWLRKKLDQDERAKLDLGRQGETTIINESGLYAVILRSDKPQAKPIPEMGYPLRCCPLSGKLAATIPNSSSPLWR